MSTTNKTKAWYEDSEYDKEMKEVGWCYPKYEDLRHLENLDTAQNLQQIDALTGRISMRRAEIEDRLSRSKPISTSVHPVFQTGTASAHVIAQLILADLATVFEVELDTFLMMADHAVRWGSRTETDAFHGEKMFSRHRTGA